MVKRIGLLLFTIMFFSFSNVNAGSFTTFQVGEEALSIGSGSYTTAGGRTKTKINASTFPYPTAGYTTKSPGDLVDGDYDLTIKPGTIISGGPEGSILRYDADGDGAISGTEFATAISTIGATQTTLLIDAVTTVSTTNAIPATLTLRFISPGKFIINTGVTLTINCSFVAPLYRIFQYSGTGTINGSPKAKNYYPEWWTKNTTPGTTDMTTAIQAAIDVGDSAYLSASKTYFISSSLSLTNRQIIRGEGISSVIKTDSSTTAIIIKGSSNTLQDFRIDTCNIGILLRGEVASCIWNRLSNIEILSPKIGLKLDGYTDAAKPCYWNTFSSILIRKPTQHGVYLTKSGAGDTPNANRFYDINVYSHGTAFESADTYSGIYIEYGRFQNSFLDCHIALGTDAHSCFRLGSGSGNVDNNYLVNLYTETAGAVANVYIDTEPTDTYIVNLFAASAGAAINDNSGGDYFTFGAGSPDTDKFEIALANEIKTGQVKYTFGKLNPPQATYFTHCYESSMPTSGSYVQGDLVWKNNVTLDGNNMSLRGWSRLTTGSNHASGTDWALMYISHVSPASGSTTWNPSSINDGNEEAKEVTVTGAALGDYAIGSFSLDVEDMVLSCQITASNTATCVLANNTGGTRTLGSGTLKVKTIN